MEMGGIYAMPNLRGGGEYGEDWHQAGMKLKKQNVFDDFIAAAGWLIEDKYTCREKLAIGGGRNGRRPDRAYPSAQHRLCVVARSPRPLRGSLCVLPSTPS